MDLKALLNNPKTYLIGLVIAWGGEKIGGYIISGAEGDIDDKIEQGVITSLKKESVVAALLNNPQFVNMIINTDEVQELIHNTGESLRDEIIEDVTREDSTKIKQNAYLAKELGIRDEFVNPLLLNMLSDYKEGKLVTKEQLRLNSGPRVTPTTFTN